MDWEDRVNCAFEVASYIVTIGTFIASLLICAAVLLELT